MFEINTIISRPINLRPLDLFLCNYDEMINRSRENHKDSEIDSDDEINDLQSNNNNNINISSDDDSIFGSDDDSEIGIDDEIHDDEFYDSHSKTNNTIDIDDENNDDEDSISKINEYINKVKSGISDIRRYVDKIKKKYNNKMILDYRKSKKNKIVDVSNGDVVIFQKLKKNKKKENVYGIVKEYNNKKYLMYIYNIQYILYSQWM